MKAFFARLFPIIALLALGLAAAFVSSNVKETPAYLQPASLGSADLPNTVSETLEVDDINAGRTGKAEGFLSDTDK